MDLLEYQAKDLFREMGIPVLPSQRIESPKDIKGLKIPYPVVLKSQVYIGGRGRVGGVRFAENTIDAIAAAQTIFNLPIMGEYPRVLLAEAKYDADREFYLAVVLNRSIRRPVLLGSQHGGVDVQAAIDQMQHVIVDQEFSPYFARRLCLKMGLQGNLIESVSAILEKMYRLFIQKDLDLVEINPLGVSPTGEVMALDGKVTVNDEARQRHPELSTLLDLEEQGQLVAFHEGPVTLDTAGQIGILCNGAGLTMSTMDQVFQAGGKPVCFLNIGTETHWDSSASTLQERLAQGLETMAQMKSVKVLLINLISGLVTCDQTAQVIVDFLKRRIRPVSSLAERRPETRSSQMRLPQLVVRLVGDQGDRAHSLLEKQQVTLVEHLDEAIAQAVALAQMLPGDA
jgi:succinyl-CoA synthetase beta subunit